MSTKKYFKCGELRKVLSHCNDEDEIFIELELGEIMAVIRRADRVADKLAQRGVSPAPHFGLRVETAYIEGSAYSSNSKSGYRGSLTFELEVDKTDLYKYYKVLNECEHEVANE